MADLASLSLKVDAAGAIRSVNEFGTAAEKSAAKAEKLTAAAQVAGVALAGLAVGALNKIREESIAAQFAQAQLEAAIRSTGGAAGFSVRQLNDQAAAFQRVSTYGDDAITTMQGVLLTFTKISGDTFPRTTQAALDLAARMGGDLKGAALQLGKALQDPERGLTMLTRAGISFSVAQQEVIKGLAETNRLAEAQALILTEVERQFGGSAEMARDTLGGALQALGHEWGNLFEVSRESSDGIITFIEGVTARLPKARAALGSFLTDTKVVLMEFERWTDERNKKFFEQDAQSSREWEKLFGGIAKAMPKGGVGLTGLPGRLEGMFGKRAGHSEQMAAAYLDNVKELDKTIEKFLLGTLSKVEDEAKKNDKAIAAAGLSAATAADQYKRLATEAARAAQVLSSGTSASAARNGTGDNWRFTSATGSGSLITRQMTPEEQEHARLKAIEEANRLIAQNFTENMQRATGQVFADFVRTGSISVREVFSTAGRLGADLAGQAISKALMPRIDSLSTGGQIGIGLGLGVLGSVVTGIVDSGRRYREAIDATRDAFKRLHSSLDEWIESAQDAFLSPEQREQKRISRDAAGFAAQAWQKYKDAPGDYLKGLTGNMAADRDFITKALAGAGGDWNKLSAGGMFGQTPASFLQAYYEALMKAAEGTKAHTDALTQQTAAQAEAERMSQARERLRSYSGIVDNLSGFRSSLKRSSLSTLNPFEQLTQARTEYEKLFERALAGDESAANRLPDAARAFLENSRGVNASGGRYSVDFNRVNADTARVEALFQDKANKENEMLAGITTTNQILTRTDGYAQQTMKATQDAVVVLEQSLAEIHEMRRELREEMAAVSRNTRRALEAVV